MSDKRIIHRINRSTMLIIAVALLTTLLIFAFLFNFMNVGSIPTRPTSTSTAYLTPTPTPTTTPTQLPTPTLKASPTPSPTQTFIPISTPTPTPTSTPISIPLWLHTTGQNIYNSNGNQVKLYMCVIQDGDGNHITQTDLQNIKNMGFNAVRIFIEWGLVQPDSPNSINTAYFTQASGASPTIGAGLDYVVNWASALGMYVVICPAWTPSWVPPLWATTLGGSNGLTSGGLSTPVDMLYNSTVQLGIFYMYNWMAHHYASNSNVVFEGFNELAASAPDDSAFASFNNGWVSAIESGEGANSHLKIIELLYYWDTAYNYELSPPYVSGAHLNVLLATHDYPLVNSASNVALDFAQTWSSTIHSQNLPWIDTELSTLGGTYSSLSYAFSLLSQYNATGWGYFCYDSKATQESNWNVNNPNTAASILPILQPAMIQP